MIAIDTSVAVGYLRGEVASVRGVEEAIPLTDSMCISAVSLFELLHPVQHRKLESQEKVVRSFVHQLRLLPLDPDSAEESARIMGSLMRIGKPVNALDVLIAGTAVAHGVERLIARDRDYEKIAAVTGLRVDIV